MSEPTTRPAILEAMDRLIEGRPQRSDGKLTVKSLAVEAGVPRHHLTEIHRDLKELFYDRIRQDGPELPALLEERRRREAAEQEAAAWKKRALSAEGGKDELIRALHIVIQREARTTRTSSVQALRALPD